MAKSKAKSVIKEKAKKSSGAKTKTATKKKVKAPAKKKVKKAVKAKAKIVAPKKVKSHAKRIAKPVVKKSARKVPSVKTKKAEVIIPLVEAPATERIGMGEDLHLIPVPGVLHPIRTEEAHALENIFHHREAVSFNQENQRMKESMATRKNAKGSYRNGGRR